MLNIYIYPHHSLGEIPRGEERGGKNNFRDEQVFGTMLVIYRYCFFLLKLSAIGYLIMHVRFHYFDINLT